MNYNLDHSPPCSLLSSHVWPSFSNWLTPASAHGKLYDLHMVDSVHSGLSWNVISLRPFLNLRPLATFYHISLACPQASHDLILSHLSSTIECVGTGPYLFHSLLYLQCLEECWIHCRCSITISWRLNVYLNKGMKSFNFQEELGPQLLCIALRGCVRPPLLMRLQA